MRRLALHLLITKALLSACELRRLADSGYCDGLDPERSRDLRAAGQVETLGILDSLGHPDADKVRAKLEAATK